MENLRLRAITGQASRVLYKSLVGVGVGVGLPITVFALWLNYQTGWENFWIREFHWSAT